MAEKLEGRARELVEAPNFASIGTIRKDGTPVINIIWADVDDDGSVVVNSAEGRSWPKNLRRDPRVAVTVPDKDNPYEYVQIHGRVVEDTHEGADEWIDRLAKKYIDADSYPFRQPGEQRIHFRIQPERVSYHGG
jgi:PPOX class probable F420-dependent enzyme